MANVNDPAGQGWHLDRRVPIVLILTLLLQGGAGIWFAASLAGTVERNTGEIEELKSDIDNASRSERIVSDKLIRLETQVESTKREVEKANRLLQQLIDQRSNR